MRDNHGRFLPGNKPINPQDKTTGRFVKKSMETTDRHSMVVKEVEELFRNKELKQIE